jgi:predicted ribosome quality control (RQC) complex YloA/Tae2 family protein
MRSLHQHQVLFPLLAENLHGLLKGFVLQDAFRNYQQTELSLVFFKGKENLSIQVNTESKTGLFLFSEFAITRNAGVFPLFKELVGLEVEMVQAHSNNRSFQLSFGSNQYLVFKMYGPLTNILWYADSAVKQLYRPSIENDRFLSLQDFNQVSREAEIQLFNGIYYVWESTESKNNILLNFGEPNGNCLLQTDSIFEALNFFTKRYLQYFLFQAAQHTLLSQYKQKIKRENATINSTSQFLDQAKKAVPFDEIGHILMANLHVISPKQEKVILQDFYRNEDLEIVLKKDLSPQENATYFYQKHKNRRNEMAIKFKQLEQAQIRLEEFQTVYARIEEAQFLKDLKPWIKEEKHRFHLPLKEKFRKFEWNGFQIYVGKNARNNDELTLKFAHKDDLWLHAKGISGSHVIIKHKPLQNFPELLIETAAAIAAYYSAAAGSEWVSVLFTPKKYVRKPKGANAGQVLVEREESILVKPKLPTN